MQKYDELGLNIGRMVNDKQLAYGDSFGKSGEILRVLYPNGVSAAQMVDFAAVTRVIDKLFRIATKKDAFGESPWRDIAGYSLLAIRREEESKPKPMGIGEVLKRAYSTETENILAQRYGGSLDDANRVCSDRDP